MELSDNGPSDFVRATLSTSIFTTEPPEHVYHYTTIEGVMGICKSRSIWATDLSYMNDTSEYVYASTIIEEFTKSYAAARPRFGGYRWVFDINPLDDLSLRVYAASFCEEKDLLSQWRAYARHGTGYAVEFSWTKLRNRVPTNRIGRVEYVQIAQERF